MRADAKKNYEHLLEVARDVVAEQGADASLRDIARRTGVGLGTLYRHFPDREALLAALLRESFDELTEQAAELEGSKSTEDALRIWVRDCVAFTHAYRGVTEMMMHAIEEPESALHASCVDLRAAGTRLLTRAQEEGIAREDLDGTELFALIAALAWVSDQPGVAPHADHLLEVILGAILPAAAGDQRAPRLP